MEGAEGRSRKGFVKILRSGLLQRTTQHGLESSRDHGVSRFTCAGGQRGRPCCQNPVSCQFLYRLVQVH